MPDGIPFFVSSAAFTFDTLKAIQRSLHPTITA